MYKNHSIIFISSGLIFTIMLIFEFSKEQVFRGQLTLWQSHWLTIIFSTSLTFCISVFSVQKILSLERREQSLTIREEKLKTLKSVMRIVHHHMNNLSHNLGIIDVEMNSFNSVNQSTLVSLHKNLAGTALEMNRLVKIEDPFNEENFKIRYN
ncbi:MAG: hypothetical protein ACI85Q_001228 [Salibacteraceae bacterium]|jgi:hypothetical protein